MSSPFLEESVPTQAPTEARYSWAVVTQASPLRIRLDGDRQPLAITPDDLSGTPGLRTVGDRVYVQMLKHSLIVIGPVSRAPKGLIPAAGTNINSLVTDGGYLIDTPTLASSLINWPGQGIPSLQTADANNGAGSYIPAQVGTLDVLVTPTRIIQTATILMNNGELGSSLPVTLKRFRSADGVTWAGWTADRDHFTATGAAMQTRIAQIARASRTNPIDISRLEYRPPYRLSTTDRAGVVSYNPQDRLYQPSSAWNDGGLQGSWLPYNVPSGPPNYYGAQYLRTHAGIVVVRGLVRSGASGSPIFRLPEGYRPAAQSSFLGVDPSDSGGSYLAVTPDGWVWWRGNVSGSSVWVNLEGITFPAADVAPNSAWTPYTLNTGDGWSVYDPAGDVPNPPAGAFPRPAWWQDMYGRVWSRGLAKRPAGNPASPNVIATFPAALVPNQQIHQAVLASGNGLYASLHYGQAGMKNAIVWKPESPAGSTGWVNFGDLVIFPVAAFPEAAWVNMVLSAGANYDTAAFPGASLARVEDGLIHYRGLISGVASGQTFTPAMGLGDRDSGAQMIFATASNSSMNRIAYNAAHTIGKLGGNGAWISLDGVRYITEG